MSAAKAEAKTECCEGDKAAAKVEVKADTKTLGAPAAAVVATKDVTCEAGSAAGAGCCMLNAAKAETKTECCEGDKAAAKVEVESDAKTLAAPAQGKSAPAATVAGKDATCAGRRRRLLPSWQDRGEGRLLREQGQGREGRVLRSRQQRPRSRGRPK